MRCCPRSCLSPRPPASQTRAANVAAALTLHRRLDTDGDGYLTYDEERAAAIAMVLPKGEVADVPDTRAGRTAFDRADLHHDGRISIAEAKAGAERAFDEADTDHDGVLSAAERGICRQDADGAGGGDGGAARAAVSGGGCVFARRR